MTTRFCGSCMADVGLDPADSRLALPGCTSTRMAFCDGEQHNCTVSVNENGAIVRNSNEPVPSADYSLKPILVPGHSLVGWT
jgi:hypothetical protein